MSTPAPIRLTIKGMKKCDRVVDLDASTLIVGPNRAGKSTVGDAIGWLACGYLPRLNHRDKDLASLMRDREMVVRMDLPDGRWCERRLVRVGAGRYSQAAAASWAGSEEDHSLAITKLFGRDDVEAAESLDVKSSLLSLSPNKRAGRIQTLIESAVDVKQTVLSAATRSVQELQGLTDDQMDVGYKAIARTIPGCREDGKHDGMYACFRNIMEGLVVGKITDSGLSSALDLATESKNNAIADIKQKRAAREEIEPRLAGLTSPLTPDQAAAAKVERTELEREVGALSRRIAEAAEKRDALEKANADTAAATAKLRDARAAAEKLHAEDAQNDDRRQRLEEVQRQLDGLEPPATEGVDVEEYDRAIAELKTRLVDVPQRSAEYPTGLADIERIKAQIVAAEHNPWETVRARAKWIKESSVGTGKLVTQLRDLADELTELADKNGSGLEGLRASLAAAEKRQQEVVDAAAKVEAERLQAQKTNATVAAEIASIVDQCNRVRDENAQLNKGKTDAYKAARAKLIEERSTLSILVRKFDDENTRIETAIKESKAKLAAATAMLDSLGGMSTTDELPSTANIEAQLFAIDQKLDASERSMSLHREFRSILDEIERLEIEAKCWRAVEAGLTRVRNESLQAQAEPLLSRMRAVIAAAGQKELPFLRAGKGECAVGWVGEAGEIQVETMSGAEFALFTAALVKAMVELRNVPIKLVVIEAAECDNESLEAMLRALGSARETLTCCIVISWHKPLTVPDGWSVVEFERSEAA